MNDLVVLADAVLCSFWFNRRQATRPGESDKAWCNLCSGEGAYHDYSLRWHDADCPLRLACKVLGRTDPLGYSVMASGWRKRAMVRAESRIA